MRRGWKQYTEIRKSIQALGKAKTEEGSVMQPRTNLHGTLKERMANGGQTEG